MSNSPNFPIRLDPERRAIWQRAANIQACSLTHLIKTATDVVASRIIEQDRFKQAHKKLMPKRKGKSK